MRPEPWTLSLLALAAGGLAPVGRSQDALAARSGDLAFWNAPGFRQRFLESYLAETEIEPTVTSRERETMLQVLDLIAGDRMDEARSLLDRSRNGAASAVLDFTLANIHFQQERLAEAAGAYRIAVQKFPKFRRAWQNLGLVQVRLGAFAAAIPALTRVIELGGGTGLTYGLLGYAHAQTENPLAAESAYRLATLLDPGTMDWKAGLARSLFRQERFADAAALCGRLIAENPDRADLWLAQGEAFARLGEPLKAAANFEVVDRLGGATATSLANLGDIYANQSLYETAVDAYLRALRKNPEGPVERALRAAKFLCGNGAFSEAKRLLAGVESIAGANLGAEDRKDLLRLSARLAVAEGSGEMEAMILERLVQLDPLDGGALLLLGQYHARRGEPEKAVFYFERAAGLEAFEADAKVRHAQLLVGQGKYAEALPLLKRAQELKPRENVQKYLEQVERAVNLAR